MISANFFFKVRLYIYREREREQLLLNYNSAVINAEASITISNAIVMMSKNMPTYKLKYLVLWLF